MPKTTVLWIAFKLYFYIGLWQLWGVFDWFVGRCELLSNCIFISVFDNDLCFWFWEFRVVNCFQIVFLYRSLTTLVSLLSKTKPLWIAFKLYFYIGLWQLRGENYLSKDCCELLSNCIFISVFDNQCHHHHNGQNVVNCFQIVFLYRSLTTSGRAPLRSMSLWIAFKLYFYIGLWQLSINGIEYTFGCELLSNCIFISVFDNGWKNTKRNNDVVNCFQIVFLYRSLTTALIDQAIALELWIAFKLYFYIGLWQQKITLKTRCLSCELLSNCIFISVFDNPLFLQSN